MSMSVLAADNWGPIEMPWNDWGESVHALMYGSLKSIMLAGANFIKDAFTAGSFDGGAGSAKDWWIAIVGGRVNVVVDGRSDLSYSMEYPGMLNVMVMAMLPILIMYVAFQVIMSVIRHSTVGMLRAFGGAVMSIPVTYMIAGLIFMALRGTDAATQWILEAGSESGGQKDAIFVSGLLSLMGMTYNPKENDGRGGVLIDSNYQLWSMASDSNNWGAILLPWLISLLICFLCVLLMAMMIFRTVMVLVLAMFTPIAVFSLSLESAKAIMGKWLGIVVGLILSKPIAAAIVMFGVTMSSLASDWVQIVAGGTLIVIAAAMPMVTMAIVSFITPEGHNRLEGATTGAMAGAGMRGTQRSVSRMTSAVSRTGGRATRGAGGGLYRGAKAVGRTATAGVAARLGGGSGASGRATGGYAGRDGGKGSASKTGSKGQTGARARGTKSNSTPTSSTPASSSGTSSNTPSTGNVRSSGTPGGSAGSPNRPSSPSDSSGSVRRPPNR